MEVKSVSPSVSVPSIDVETVNNMFEPEDGFGAIPSPIENPFGNTYDKPSSESYLEINTSDLAGNKDGDSVFLHENESFQDNIFRKPLSPGSAEDYFRLNINKLQNTGRETLTILKDLNLSPGKESLGILKLEAINASFNDDYLGIPTICLSKTAETVLNISDNPLNTAFLYSVNSRKPSTISDNSFNGNPSFSFNSASLEGSQPSKVLSCNSFKTFDALSKSEDPLNEAFLSTFNKFDVNGGKERAHSADEERSKDLENLKGLNRGCSSVAECYTQYENSSPKQTGLSDLGKDEDVFFNESIFIEAKFLASKIADGSILDEVSIEDLLDSTGPPDFSILDQIEADDCDINIETEKQNIFKTLDKLLSLTETTDNQANNSNVDVPISDITYNKESVTFNYSQRELSILKKYDESEESQKNNATRVSSNGSAKSKNANELLHDLSEMINDENRDPKEKRKGQQLLSNLANILCPGGSKLSSNKLEYSEDSGHSSIENEEQQNEQELPAHYQVSDLRTPASKSDDNIEVLDLSMKSRNDFTGGTNKRASQSFSFPSPKESTLKVLSGLKATPMFKSSTSLDSKSQYNSDFARLKPKRIEKNSVVTRKGPLKAVIPIGSMAKGKSLSKKPQCTDSTPPKAEKGSSSFYKTKRTSTPISEPSIKPMAQSTPDNKFQQEMDTKPISCSSQLKKKKFYCPISPLARPPSFGNISTDSELCKSNHTGSAPNLSSPLENTSRRSSRGNSMIPAPSSPKMHRRHSATDLKVTNTNSSKLRRSYSIGKEARPSTINSQKTSTETSTYASQRQQNILQEKNIGILSKIKSPMLGKLSKKGIGKKNKENSGG